jgi:hypothetical protein
VKERDVLKRSIGLIVVSGLLMGCAASRPTMLVLPRGDTTMAEYQADEVARQPYAEAASKGAWNQQYWNSFGQGLMAGAAGASVGTSVGSGFGMAGYGAQVGAATGFAHGAMWDTVTPAAASQVADNMPYAQCMRTKGHKLPGLQSIDDQPSRRGGQQKTSNVRLKIRHP